MQQKILVRIVLFSSALMLIALNAALAQLSPPEPPDLSADQRTALRRAFGQCRTQAGDDPEKLRTCMDSKVSEILTAEQQERWQNRPERTPPPGMRNVIPGAL
jgi:ABC-type transporter MlaC component